MSMTIIVFSRSATAGQLEQPPPPIVCSTRRPLSCYASWCQISISLTPGCDGLWDPMTKQWKSQDQTLSTMQDHFYHLRRQLWNSVPAQIPIIRSRASFRREVNRLLLLNDIFVSAVNAQLCHVVKNKTKKNKTNTNKNKNKNKTKQKQNKNKKQKQTNKTHTHTHTHPPHTHTHTHPPHTHPPQLW